MEFAVIGASPATLAGSHPLQPWGQAAEVLSRFPSAEGSSMEGGKGKGDSSFVQGLGEFCFPSGASIALVDGREAVSRCPPQLFLRGFRRGGLRGLLARRPTTKKKSTLRFVIGLFPRRCFVIGLLACFALGPSVLVGE